MRRPLLLAVVLLPVLATAFGCNEKSRDLSLPADLLALLPAAPTAIVATAGLEAMDLALADLDAHSADDPLLPPEARAQLDLRAALDKAVPGVASLVDPTLPLALAAKAPPPMVSDMGMTLVLPLLDPAAELPPLPPAFKATVVRGRYVAISTDPAHAARDTVPELARDLKPGVATMAVDLQGLIEQYRGLLEMGLGMMAVAPAPDPDQPGAARASSPAETRALVAMARGMMDSARRLDLALDLSDGRLTVTGMLGIRPDGPLQPGPQPDFAAAAVLTSLLPRDADVLQASASNQANEVAFTREYYLASVARQAEAMPPEEGAAFLAWFEGYLALVPRLACPAATALDFGNDGIAMLAVMQPDDPAALAAALTGQMARLAEAGLGVTFLPLEPDRIDGVAVQRWRMAIDEAAILALGRDSAGTPGGEQALQTVRMLGSLLPDLSLATVEGHMLLGATADPEQFAALVTRVGQRAGKPDGRIAKAAAAAGPDVCQVIVGDLMPLANWLVDLSRGMAGFEGMPPLDTPVPFVTAATAGSDGYGFLVGTDVPAIRAAVAAAEAMVHWRNGVPQP